MMFLTAGRPATTGAPLEVYARPATTYVASFIGSPPMNLIAGRVEDGGKVLAAEGGVKLRLPAVRPALNGRSILLGVRPEHLEPCAQGEASIVAEIDLIEPLGAETLVYGHIGSGASSARVAARLHATALAAEGRLALRFADSAVHLFDPESGKRLDA
jgi:sn-glycerol 3-phosphate transport system ATP-binding protein